MADSLEALISQSLSLHRTQPVCLAASRPTHVSKKISSVYAIIHVRGVGGGLKGGGYERLRGETFPRGIPRTRLTQSFSCIPWDDCSVAC